MSDLRFVVVSRTAAESLAADRFLQSCEFEPGLHLAELLSHRSRSPVELPRVIVQLDNEGLVLLGRKDEISDALVFDLDADDLFAALTPEQTLFVFQKVLRFALRYWSKQKLNANERVISGSSKAVVFPFPISTQSSFRVIIELDPDSKRLAKRPHVGKCLLVFRSGLDDKSDVATVPSVSIFRKALETLASARSSARDEPSARWSLVESPIELTRLSPLHGLIDGHVGFDTWEHNLTSSQKAFVHSVLTGPHRIEGPAGSGKTICLVLRAIATLRAARLAEREHRSLFLAHSEATRRTIQGLFDANDLDRFSSSDPYSSPFSIRVTTLHQLCGELLGREISESEFLDRDALESKNVQLLYVDEALSDTLRTDLHTFRPFLSEDFAKFLESEEKWAVAQMLQHEISVVIKGRAEESLDKYRRVPRTPTGLPLHNESDRGFVFLIFQKYQAQLRAAAAFDTDDVVLSALGQLNTPIWRRRRTRDGYDSIFVDETHLFNLNELSMLHYLTKSETAFPIAYATDPSQALEDRGWSDELFDEALGDRSLARPTTTTRIKSVFRCSPDIVNLALSVTSSGATLFANFDDPLRTASSAFTEEDERQCAPPVYLNCANDDEMVKATFSRAEAIANEVQGGRAKVAIVVFDEILWTRLKRVVSDNNKPAEFLVQRGDIEVVRRAERAGRFVVGTPDYVGGLEFAAVVLVGVDHGRVPPSELLANSGSAAFLSYQAHSRLYVAITRARYRVEMLGNTVRGPSKLLTPAIEHGALQVRDFAER